MATNPPLRATIIPVTPLQQNCTLIWCTATMKGAAIDPGGDLAKVKAAAAQNGVTIEKVLLTHGHIDHAGLAGVLAEELGVPIEGPHEDDAWLLAEIEEHGPAYGVPAKRFVPGRWLAEGDTVAVGDLSLEVYHTPGHTPGHVIFFHRPSRFAQVGDVLFAGSVGRTDFPRSDHQALLRSVVEKLWPLGDDVAFVPGHGPTSTFGRERASNPFVADVVLARG